MVGRVFALSIIDMNTMVSAFRKRMKWTQSQLLEHMKIDDKTMERLVRNKRGPKASTVDKLPAVVNRSKTLSISYLQGQPLETYEICKALEKSLEREDIDEAERLLTLFEESGGTNLPLNRHYYLAQKALLMLLQKTDAREILPIIKEGLQITGLDPNDFEDEPLMHQEPRLLLALARVYACLGDTAAAVKLLRDIDRGIDSYAYDDGSKDRIVAPVLLALARLQLESRDYEGTLATCGEGMEVSVKWCQGRHFPDFLFIQTQALHASGGNVDAESLYIKLATAYAGFLSLGNLAKSRAVSETSRDMFGINLESHGVGDMLALVNAAAPYGSKMPKGLPIYDLGETIRILREAAELTLKELSEGICNFTTLSRIESGETQNPDFYTIEAITQRLGINILGYRTFYLSNKELVGYEMRTRVQMLLRHHKYDEAEVLLVELGKRKAYKKGVNLQYVETAKATIYGERHGDNPKYLKMLHNALKLTIPNFDEKDISRYHLTLCEANLVNQIAGYYMQTKKMRQSVRVYEYFLDSITAYWKDEDFLARFFATASFNYSTCLGRINEGDEALKVVEKALAFEQWHGRLVKVGELLFNKAYNNFKRFNKKKESLPFFVLSFYMLIMFSDYGKMKHVETVRKFILEEYGVTL